MTTETRRQPQRTSRTPALGAGLVLLLVVLLATCGLSLVIGSRTISISDVLDALGTSDPTNFDNVVVRTGRVPRTLIGLAVGAALGLAGTVMQGVTRNPLAEPGLLGINAGAAFAVVVGLVGFGLTSASQYIWFAFAGAAVAAVVVFLIGSRGPRGASPTSLVLAGAALTALLLGITSLLLRNVNSYDEYRRWTVGSLAGRGVDVLAQVAPYLIAGIVLALLLGPVLNVMTLGPDVARALGQNVGRAQILNGLTVVLLCGGATAVAGPIVFLGLAVPHIARIVTGPDFRWILPYSALIAPIVLLLADIIGRVVAAPGELQVGVVTALLGAPLFIVLVRYRKTSELWPARR